MIRRVLLVLTAVLLLQPSGAPARAASRLKLRVLPALYTDSRERPLSEPEAVAFGASLLAVADTGNGRIVTYSVSPEGIEPAGEFALPEIPYPVQIGVTSGGDLLVLDGRSRRIARVGRTGEFKGYLDLGRPAAVRAMALDRAGHLYVLDVGGPRILTFDPAGKPAGETSLPADAGFFSDLAVDTNGDTFLVDSVGRQLWVARAGAADIVRLGPGLEGKVEFPTSLAVTRTGHILLVDQNGGGIAILGPTGVFEERQLAKGWREGFLRDPSDIATDGEDRVFVADRANNRVQVLVISQ